MFSVAHSACHVDLFVRAVIARAARAAVAGARG